METTKRIDKGQAVMFHDAVRGRYLIGEAMESGESTIAVLYVRKSDGGAERHDIHATKLTPVYRADGGRYFTIPE